MVVISGVLATHKLKNNQGFTFDENNQNLNIILETSEWNHIHWYKLFLKHIFIQCRQMWTVGWETSKQLPNFSSCSQTSADDARIGWYLCWLLICLRPFNSINTFHSCMFCSGFSHYCGIWMMRLNVALHHSPFDPSKYSIHQISELKYGNTFSYDIT